MKHGKKLLALTLCGALALSLCAVGAAADKEGDLLISSNPAANESAANGGMGGGNMGTPPDGMGGGDMGTPPGGMGGGDMGTPPDGMGGGDMSAAPDGMGGDTAAAGTPSDISGHWAEQAILATLDLFPAVTDTAFEPDTVMTRGEFLQVLYNLNGADWAYPSTGAFFTDITADSDYAQAVGWAKELGLCNGNGTGASGAGKGLSRQDMMVFLNRYCTAFGIYLDTAKSYDANAGETVKGAAQVVSYAKQSVDHLLDAGMAALYSEGFTGSKTVTRGEVAAVIDLLRTCGAEYDLIRSTGTVTFAGGEHIRQLELTGDATVRADVPVIVYFEESETVQNGDCIGNVQFVSDYDEVIAIVHTNDVHGHLEVEPYVKAAADALKATGDYSLVLTVSAGDVYGGGEAVAGSYDGELIPAVMDKVYDVMTLGNNDFGSTGVVRQTALLTALYENTVTLCANLVADEDGMEAADWAAAYSTAVSGNELFSSLYSKVSLKKDGTLDLSALELKNFAAGELVFDTTYTVTTDKGTVLGLYGITTSGGACEVDVDALGSISTAQSCVNSLIEQGATAIVGLGHTGWMGEGSHETSSNDTNSWQLCLQVEGQDAFVDSHTHSIINDGAGALADGVFINQAQSVGTCYGVMYLYLKDGSVVACAGELVEDMSDLTPDAEVLALVEQLNAKVKEDFGRAIAETPYFLNGERLSAGNDGGSVRGNETNLGDLMTDAILTQVRETTDVDYDFCVYPGYWLRSSVEAGDLTQESLQAVFANPTALEPVEYTAEDVLSMVKKGLSSVYPEAEGTTFNQYSGVTVTYTRSGSSGTPVTIHVGETLVYDANNGGVQVASDWTCKGIFTLTGGEIDNYTGSTDHWICQDKGEVQQLVASFFQTHTAGEDYTIYPNTIAPAGRVVEVNG